MLSNTQVPAVPDIVEEVQRAFTWQQILTAIGIFLLFLLFRKLFTTYIFKAILFFSRKVSVDTLTNVLLAFERPMRSFLVFIGLFVAFVYVPFDDTYEALFVRIFRTILIFHIFWGLFNLSASSSSVFTQIGRRFNVEFDQILLPFLSKLIRFAIVVMGLSIIASEWEYNVQGFVAGLGLGGLAFALAAQQTLGNFFGGVVIITEKPFTLGDWIKTPSVEGFVEDISFRSTSVRTFEDSLVVVPNSTLSNEPIENWTKMGKRQISFSLGVEYQTPAPKIRRCVERIEAELRQREDIDDELIIVRFTTFNESSLDLFLYFFTRPTGWVDHLNIKQEINYAVLDILESEGVSVAFPTQKLYIHDEKKGEDHAL
ncbi:mechanosensitive ion channel family protein [Alkalicoccus urumqiensis]|uniref:Mechanosensitive ion channel protein n=1 Tax=Alkalicoccus urumqiensis TaxID=1548213 RepID=A0A2P6MEU0_ALKUR|nr:mechanosensitive ion channel family protein [Alkalicoccus urumqiensis]PRO64784.1 mechanosensitive ion channel protein [Alkalicoccus urumqiensis]